MLTLLVGLWGLVAAVWDAVTWRLPNWLTLPGAAVILVVLALLGSGHAALLGLVLGPLPFALSRLWTRGIGGGDIKLLLGLGAHAASVSAEAVLCLWCVPWLIFAGQLALTRQRAAPLGPALVSGWGVGVVLG